MGNWRETARNLGLLVLRVMAGLGISLLHGHGKVFGGNMQGFADNAVAPMGFPLPIVFAWLAALTEFLGGLLIAAGFMTRLVALPLVFNMLVALVGVHMKHGHGLGQMEAALWYLTAWVTVLLTGPGTFSVDRVLLGKKA